MSRYRVGINQSNLSYRPQGRYSRGIAKKNIRLVRALTLYGLLCCSIFLTTAMAKQLKQSFKAPQLVASVKAEGGVEQTATPLPTPLPTPKVVVVKIPVSTPTKDDRVNKLHDFLVSQGSPLADYAGLIVADADQYDIGWTKIVAISGMESSYGTKLPAGSYNAWGIGGHNLTYFKSWEDGINYASWLIGTQYKQNENQGIKDKYCPSSDGCNPEWAANVTDFSNQILASTGGQ